jgi:hypothetical protein
MYRVCCGGCRGDENGWRLGLLHSCRCLLLVSDVGCVQPGVLAAGGLSLWWLRTACYASAAAESSVLQGLPAYLSDNVGSLN